jgi:hypothetical protein
MGAGGCIMSWFSSDSRASVKRQVLRLERLETRDCPSGLGGHVHALAGVYQVPPTPPPPPHAGVVLHYSPGIQGHMFIGVVEVPPTPPPTPH